MAEQVHAEVSADGTRLSLVIEGPNGNALTVAMIESVRRELKHAETLRHLKLLSIAGAGADFSYGSSIEEHRPEAIGDAMPPFHALIRELLEVPAPTAALLHGRCLGGGLEVALACDLVFAEADALLGFPEIRLGVFAPVASVLLPARVGASRAAAILLTGQPRPAAAWQAAGAIEAVAPAGRLAALVDDWYRAHLAPRSAAALRHACRAARLGLRRLALIELPEAERIYLQELMRTDDAAEGISAFLEKRAPRWKDR